MDWAIVQQGRSGREDVLILLGNRPEAESIAVELRRHGQAVDVVTYADGVVGASR